MFYLTIVVALGMVAMLAVVRLTMWFLRTMRRSVAALPGALKSLTVEPPQAFNDSRDVWPMPKDD